jgi:flagellar protein FliS
MTTAAAMRARYARDGKTTASPNRLLLMLWDRLVLDVEVGVTAMREKDFATSSKRLQNAQAILMQLRSTLDLEKWPAGRSTADLYVFLYQELVAANIGRDSERARTTIPMLRSLRDTWHKAAQLVAKES